MRMGGRPKCLLLLDGEPLLVRLCHALQRVGVARPVVVLGHHADRVETAMGDLAVRVVRNPLPDLGPASSLRLGLQAVPDTARHVLVALADQPLVGEPELRALLAAYGRRPDGCDFLWPQVVGQPGNPFSVRRSGASCWRRRSH